MRRSTMRGHLGDHLVIDDRTGFTEWASNVQKEWTGALVHRKRYEARHPQDFVRAVRDDLRVDPARPDRVPASANFSGPLYTTIIAQETAPLVYLTDDDGTTQLLDDDVSTNLTDDEGGVLDNDRRGMMGALGEFALGQTEESLVAYNQAGSFTIAVESTAGITAHDRVTIVLDSGDVFQSTVRNVPGPQRLILMTALPGITSPGNLVIDTTTTTSSSLG